MLKKANTFLAAMFLFTIGLCSTGFAHNLWLNPGNYYPEVGTTVEIGIGWGHTYPANRIHQEVKDGKVADIHAVDPNGAEVALTKVSADKYTLAIDKPGAWLITARIDSGFFTTTPEGRKWGNKTTVENPIKCTNFHIQAKTLLIAGGSDKGLGNAAGQSLEVIPLANPKGIRAGGTLPVKLVFNGEPLADAAVNATYAGFEPPKPPDAAKAKANGKKMHQKKQFPAKAVTDAQGKAALTLDRVGYWMLMLSHRCPFADSGTCDEYMYNMAFTVEIPE